MAIRAVLALLVSLGLVIASPAAVSALTRTTVTISATVFSDYSRMTYRTAMPGEGVLLSGAVTRSAGRVMVLQQRISGGWREVARRTVDATWRFAVVARTPGVRSYRVVALRTATADEGVSPTRVITVVQPSISVTPAAAPAASRLIGFTGRAFPARAGVPVQLWELRGSRWVSIADTLQRSDGSFSMRVLAGARGSHTYRAVTASKAGATAVRSPTRAVATAAPPAAWSVYLTDASPHTCLDCANDFDNDGLGDVSYVTAPVTAAGRSWVKSARSSTESLAYALGGTATSLSTAIALQPVRSTFARKGPRLVDVRVDGRLRLRTFVSDGQTLPLTLDVRGAQEVRFSSVDQSGFYPGAYGSDFALLTPVVSSAVHPERGVDTTTALTELPRAASSGRRLGSGVVISTAGTLRGGSLTFGSDNSDTTASSGLVDYDLNGRYTALTGFPMLYGELESGLSGKVQIYGDGRLLASLPAPERHETLKTVDVTGVRRLRVELVAEPVDRELGYNYSWGVALADPRLR